jgi:hypothetical protein
MVQHPRAGLRQHYAGSIHWSGAMPLQNFAAAIAEVRLRHTKIHALLGNGFSRACRDDIFAYGALFDRADFAALSPSARSAFDALGTRDFEVVIQALRQSERLLPVYGDATTAAAQMRADADGLREVLVSAIANSHPDFPAAIRDDQYAACRQFLRNFNRIYTLNYDLLLYWALMHTDANDELRSDDGFRNGDEDGVDYVVWDPASSNRDQNVFYVHGGLHLFDAGSDLVKYTWSRTGVRLIDQVRLALAEEKYPLFVAEGRSDEKLERIRHHAYLARIERSMLEITGALFLYGVSCGDSDRHILDWISKGKLSEIHVGVFGDPDSDANRALRTRAIEVGTRRRKGAQPTISFFDAASARVWG